MHFKRHPVFFEVVTMKNIQSMVALFTQMAKARRNGPWFQVNTKNEHRWLQATCNY